MKLGFETGVQPTGYGGADFRTKGEVWRDAETQVAGSGDRWLMRGCRLEHDSEKQLYYGKKGTAERIVS